MASPSRTTPPQVIRMLAVLVLVIDIGVLAWALIVGFDSSLSPSHS